MIPYQNKIFITGIGTGIGKTVVSAIITEALEADYWKPIQAGFEEGTDSTYVKQLISNLNSIIHSEVYKLSMPASPHIASAAEGIEIDLAEIKKQEPTTTHANKTLIIEGAGGLMVPLSKSTFVVDLIQSLNAKVLLVSRNYLGSINHSLLTATVCKERKLDVIGWLFNDQYLNYEAEIANWSGYENIGSIPSADMIDKDFINEQAQLLRPKLLAVL
jgi:dethiobiotin synthetase